MHNSLHTLTTLALAATLVAHATTAQDGAPQDPKPKQASTDQERPQRFRSGGYFGLYLEERGVKRKRRVVIRDVVAKSDAARLGFRKGDVVLDVDGQRVRNGDQFIQLLYMTDDELAKRLGRRKKKQTGGAFEQAEWHYVRVLRDGKRVNLNVTLSELDKHPKVGQLAPDFTAKSIDGKRDVRLGTLLGKKPLVLIFGSFT